MDAYVIYCVVGRPPAKLLLTIPVTAASTYSSKPLKWIRYVTGAVLGAEGTLRTFGINNEDLDLDDEEPVCRKLIFIPSLPIRFVDPDGLNHLASSQITTESRTVFRAALEGRDVCCVATDDFAALCEASHLIPHSKGSEVRSFFI